MCAAAIQASGENNEPIDGRGKLLQEAQHRPSRSRGNWECRLQDYAASREKVAALDFESLLPGHHAISFARRQEAREEADRLFRLGFVPRIIV